MGKMVDTLLKEWLGRVSLYLPNLSFNQDLFVVGGAVRDYLLGRPPRDIDLVCHQADIFAEHLAASQLIPTTVVPFGKKHQEPCFRVVSKSNPHRFIDVVEMHGSSIEDDLARRDFTINAMAVEVLPGGEIGKWIDPFNGRTDIDRHLIRACSPDVFTDDPLRILRAVRFAAELDFSLETPMPAHMRQASSSLKQTASERIWTELRSLLACPRSAFYFEFLDDIGVLSIIFPEITGMHGCTQNDYHHRDVWGHTLEVVSYCDDILGSLEQHFGDAHFQIADQLEKPGTIPILKLAALLHDMGKPRTKRFSLEKNRSIFHGHADAGAEMADAVARRLKMSNADRQLLVTLIRHHMRPVELYLPQVKEKTVIRWFRRIGDDIVLVLILALADVHGKAGEKLKPSVKKRFYKWAKQAAADYFNYWKGLFETTDLVTGKDLLGLGLSPGPTMGDILRHIRGQQDEGRISRREQALLLAEQLVRQQEDNNRDRPF